MCYRENLTLNRCLDGLCPRILGIYYIFMYLRIYVFYLFNDMLGGKYAVHEEQNVWDNPYYVFDLQASSEFCVLKLVLICELKKSVNNYS